MELSRLKMLENAEALTPEFRTRIFSRLIQVLWLSLVLFPDFTVALLPWGTLLSPFLQWLHHSSVFLPVFSGAVVIKPYRLGGLNDRHLLLEAGKPRIKVLADFVAGENFSS